MGIKGLETYIRENPHENIAQAIDIREEIEKWQRKNDEKNPTIIINFVNFVKILANIDRSHLIRGGEYHLYNKKITQFFDRLRDLNVKLVFFCRPFLSDIDEKTVQKAYDCVVQKEQLDQLKEDLIKRGVLFPWHLDKRFLYNLMQICSNYGEVHTHLSGTTFNIVEYVREHQDEVLAMIQGDTDYLLFDGQYQYWSLADLDILRFTTKKYCRETLYGRLQLNTKQCQMLSALSRLDNHFIQNFVRSRTTDEESGKTIFKLASYVRDLENLDSLERIGIDIFGENYTAERLEEIQHEMTRFEMPLPDNLDGYDKNFRDLVDFFLEKNLYFAYGLAVGTVSTNQALAYIDLRQQGSIKFVKLMTALLMMQCGIMFKDMEERPATRAVKSKRTTDAENNDEYTQDIVYPPPILPKCPSLKQLIIQEEDSSFDDSRWFYFGWLLGFDNRFIIKVRSQFYSKFMRIVSYTLKFLVMNKVISFREADIIFLTEWNSPNGRDKNVNSPGASSNISSDRDVEWQRVLFTKSNGQNMSHPPGSENVTSFTSAAASNSLSRDVTEALFTTTPISFAPIPVKHNIAPLYNPRNWRDPYHYRLPESRAAAPMYLSAMNGFKRNGPPPHNWSNYNRWHARAPRHDLHFIDRAWIQIAHKYTITFESVCHCLELSGLRKETDLIQFDALNFHCKMRQTKKDAIDAELRASKQFRMYY